jgi:hypothetical protein
LFVVFTRNKNVHEAISWCLWLHVSHLPYEYLGPCLVDQNPISTVMHVYNISHYDVRKQSTYIQMQTFRYWNQRGTSISTAQTSQFVLLHWPIKFNRYLNVK